MSSLFGIVLEFSDFDAIRASGFTDFRTLEDEMHYDDEERFQSHLCQLQECIEAVSDEYVVGCEDGAIALFSNNPLVIDKIKSLFPLNTLMDAYPVDRISIDHNGCEG